LLWWAAAMACCLLGVVSAAAWRGGHVSGGPLVGAFCFSVVAAASAVWSRRRHRLRGQERA
jgi:ABC-type Mn2+/Zn2+ transport system permease subunit